MLAGRGFLVVVKRRTTPDVVVDVDMALLGREEPPGVTSPEREPMKIQEIHKLPSKPRKTIKDLRKKNFVLFYNHQILC